MDNKKPPISLIPREAIEEEARAFGYGAGKHGVYNFREGNDYSLFIDAAMRHLFAFADGENIDKDSGEAVLQHLACVRANCAILMSMLKSGRGNDDRWKNPPLKGFMNRVEIVEDPTMKPGDWKFIPKYSNKPMITTFPKASEEDSNEIHKDIMMKLRNDIVMGGSKK